MDPIPKKHNLIADGKWGPNTAKTLYGETMQRISTIKANLERIRWMPNKLPQTRVWVDITGFSAAIHSHSGDFKTTAIMGRPDRKTRIFDDELTHFVINPIWRVPNRIAREDLLPRFQRDSSYITNHHYQVFASWSATTPLNSHEIDWNQFNEKYFPLRIEQLPSASNSLGKYKFMFPNKYGIYLHDTPQKELFKRLDLAHSSGCGRLMEPQLFAYKLLEVDQQTNKDLQSSKTKTIHLKTRIPVYLTYFTIWPDHTGRLIPRNDLYNQDAALIAAFS